MEQLHPFQGGEVQGVLTPHEESHDEHVIRQGIEAAQKEEREIDDRTARYIASQLHGGQDSALYALASSGAVIEDDVYHELYEDLESHTLQVQQWVEALRTYCLNRERKEPIAGWARRAAELDKRDEQRWRLVGGMALANEASASEEREQEQDQFDDLFGEVPDEEIGTVDELGWFGLVRHEDKPGGLLLCQDEQGFRYIWEANSDEALAERWSAVTAEYGRFHEQQRAYGHEPGEHEEAGQERGEREDTPSSHHPEIWVGSLSDYNNGRLHGVWLDAMLEPEELHEAVQFMLRNSYVPGAEEWAIFDYDDFCGLNLGEYQSLEMVSRIAKGIAEHGEAFAAWVNYVGETSEEALETFEDHYQGHFESTEAYVEYILEETDSYRYFEEMMGPRLVVHSL